MATDIERRLAAILSADVAGYSRLMARDESATVDTVERYRERIGELVREHRGRLVDFTGDNFLAEFPTATDAVACGVAVHGHTRSHGTSLPADRRMEFRIGIHVGEIRIEGERIYGHGVNTAARLQALAEVAGTCVSAAVFEQVRRTPGFSFDDLGPHEFKNLPDPVTVYRVRTSEVLPTKPTGAGDKPSIAVLPFVNMSPDPDQEFFADGMAEELISALAQVPGLRVIARTSAFSFKGTNADIATIGRKLGVSTIVEGSVRKARDRLRITVQLVEVAGGTPLWSEVFDRSIDDVFEIQDEIARTIVKTIQPKLTGVANSTLVSRSTESREAYELYLRAGDRIAHFDRWDTQGAIEMLREATSIDPEFADAWARLALAYSQQGFAFDPDPLWHAKAEAAVRRAFDLDPDNASAYLARGRILWSPACGFQHAPALRSLCRCLELQPGSNQARLWRSMVLLHVGLFDEARAGFDEVLEAEPDDVLTLNCIAQVAQFQARYDEAAHYMERAHRMDPNLWVHHSFMPPLRIYLGDFSGAEDALRKARQRLGDDPLLDSCDAMLWAKRGERALAEEALARAATERPSIAHAHHGRHYSAVAYALLGRPHEAIGMIHRAVETGMPNYGAFHDDPHLAVLRGEPEMEALLADLERQAAGFRAEFGRG